MKILYSTFQLRIITFCIGHNSFNYPHERESTHEYLGDIFDGLALEGLMAPGELLSFTDHTGLILCSDGAPIFKSSQGGSIWSVYLAVTSISPEERMKLDNIIVAAAHQNHQ